MKKEFTTMILGMLITAGLRAQAPAQTIPDFTFSRPDKSVFTGKDLARGKMLFFVFFDSDCEHCQRAVQNIDRQCASFRALEIYLVSMDDRVKMDRFLDTYATHLKNRKNVVVLQDNLNQFIVKFKPYKYPSMFLYSTDKKLVDYEDNEETVFRFVNAIKKITLVR